MVKTFVVSLLCFSAAGTMRGESCAVTAEAAVAKAVHGEPGFASEGGFRIAGLRVEVAHTWAMVANCAHPAAPLVAYPVRLSAGMKALAETPSVRIGDRVRVVREQGGSRFEVEGWAQEAGAMTQAIRVRLQRFTEDVEAAPAVIRCTVIGRGLVEAGR